MGVDPSVLAAVSAAVEADPENAELRAHLARLLLDAGEHGQALAAATKVLSAVPDHLEALIVAADAARATGDQDRAERYERLVAALRPDGGDGGAAHGGPPPGEPPMGARVPDTVDDLLEGWAGTDAVEEVTIGELTEPTLTLADVGGMEQVKQQLERSFIGPMRNPHLRATFGKSLQGGLLMWGPPGCGKTFLARAVAGDLGASFYNVGLSDVLDMWIGASERNLTSIFEIARRNAPCVLFFDELDALGQKRSQLRGGGGAMRGVVNQLLTELDGAGGRNDGVFVLGATNHPWDVDPALLRPGRFDRSLLVLPPDAPARAAIFEVHLRGRPTEPIDFARLAKATQGLTGADIALICEHATELALEASMSSGDVVPIAMKQLQDAAASQRGSVDPWIDVARNYAMYANDSGLYDELEAYLRQRRRR